MRVWLVDNGTETYVMEADLAGGVQLGTLDEFEPESLEVVRRMTLDEFEQLDAEFQAAADSAESEE